MIISDPYGSMWLDAPSAIRFNKSMYTLGDLHMSGATRRIGGEGAGCYLLTGWDPDRHRLDFYASLTDGTSPVLVSSLRDQYLEIAKGKLTGNLNANTFNIVDVGDLFIRRISIIGAGVFSDWKPNLDDARDLGISTFRWRNVYTSRGIIIPASYNILCYSYAGVDKTVTETVETLKDEVLPTSPKNVLLPQYVYIKGNNPAGSTVTLIVSVKFVYSDGTETTLDTLTILEGTETTENYSPFDIAKIYENGVSVTGVRLYAYVSATPAAGYEPTVTLLKVTGFQF